MRWAADPTGRFSQRPFYQERELDSICEDALEGFFRKRLGRRFTPPLTDDDLQNLVENHVGTLDLYADLTAEGADVEALTEFQPNHEPIIRVDQRLSADPRRRNRLRTGLAHELGHVLLHRFLYEDKWKQGSLFGTTANDRRAVVCRHGMILGAGKSDWQEWQAGYACGAILMPRSHLMTVVKSAIDDPTHFVLGAAPILRSATVAAVAQAFQVSEEAARVRLEVVGAAT